MTVLEPQVSAFSKMNGKSPKLHIDFLIIGASIAGLSCAIALRRVGHRVLILEKDGDDRELSGGTRLAPNLSKVLFHWGLERELKAIATTSSGVYFLVYETGEHLGSHQWSEEMLQEARGEFVFAHHSDFRHLLYRTAIRYGARILHSQVVDIIPEKGAVKLASGHVLRGDVVVAADGPSSIARRLLLEAEGKTDADDGSPSGLMLYNTTVPKSVMKNDPELRFFYDQPYCTQFVWFGDGHCVIAYPVGGFPDFAMQIYVPQDGSDRHWKTKVPAAQMLPSLRTSEPRLQKLAKLAKPASCVQVKDLPELEHWVHESGRMLIVGEAAHPLPPGAIQGCAMAVEDGAVLAKLFSHLLSEDQIGSFLWAFQELRHERVSRMLRNETMNLGFMALPRGEQQEMRDQAFLCKHRAGRNVLEGDEGEAQAQWEEIKNTFGYSCEDEADDWWIKWGLLRERARGNWVQPALNLRMSIMSVHIEQVVVE